MASYPWHWDFFFDKYPYTDFHELNLDWLIHAIKYWYKNVDFVRQAIATGSEDGNKYYEAGHSAGDLIWWRGEFYRLTKDVNAGDDIDCNSIEHISVEDLLDEEEAARIAADNQLQKNIDAEEAARIAADNAESAARSAADTALGQRIDKEISDRTSADSALQNQITSNDTDIANLQNCCQTVQNTISDHETRITKNRTDIDNIDSRVTTNTTNITNITNQINSGTSPSGVKDTNTLTQLTYHEWRGKMFLGTTGISYATAMMEVAQKVNEIVAGGGHAELCRVQLYGNVAGTSEENLGINTSEYLNTNQNGDYGYSAAGHSLIEGDADITSKVFSTVASRCEDKNLYYSSGSKEWTYNNVDLSATTDTLGWTWQYRLIYQTADYVQLA